MVSPSLVHHSEYSARYDPLSRILRRTRPNGEIGNLRLSGTAPETMGGRTVPVVAMIRFLTILGRTQPNGKITNLRLFGKAGITVKVRQTRAPRGPTKQPKERPGKVRSYEGT